MGCECVYLDFMYSCKLSQGRAPSPARIFVSGDLLVETSVK